MKQAESTFVAQQIAVRIGCGDVADGESLVVPTRRLEGAVLSLVPIHVTLDEFQQTSWKAGLAQAGQNLTSARPAMNRKWSLRLGDIFALEHQEWEAEHVVGMPMGEKQMLDITRIDSGAPQLWHQCRRRVDQDAAIQTSQRVHPTHRGVSIARPEELHARHDLRMQPSCLESFGWLTFTFTPATRAHPLPLLS